MRKRSICFVTNEFYPLGPGGIGRLMYNFAKHNAACGFPADIHFLVPSELVEDPLDQLRLSEAVEGIAEVHVAPSLDSQIDKESQLIDLAASEPWSIGALWGESFRYYRELLAIEERRGKPFDVVEFPDFGGWGVAAVEAKRCGMALQETMLAARLHSTQGVIARAERFSDPSPWAGVLMDAEAHLLRHADIIVGHTQSIIDHNSEHYDLEDRWRGRTVLEFPPIILDTSVFPKPISHGAANGDRTDFIFSSRLQRFKRPDLFVRASIRFLERNPGHKGVFRLVSYGWEQGYIAWVKSLVPESLREKIVFIEGAEQTERDNWLAHSVVIIPSDYESLCLFAYEASCMGTSVILNRECSAFGRGERWVEGENCLMFDGSVEGLVLEMERSTRWSPNSKVSVQPDQPYWINATNAVLKKNEDTPRVCLVGLGYKSASELEEHFSELVILLANTELQSVPVSKYLMVPHQIAEHSAALSARAEKAGWEVISTSGVEECPTSLRRRLVAMSGDAVIMAGPGVIPSPGFIRVAANAIALNPNLSVVGGFAENLDFETGQRTGASAFAGEMPSVAMLSNQVAPFACLITKSLLEKYEFDSKAMCQWFEVFIRECAINGEEIAILPIPSVRVSRIEQRHADLGSKLSAGIIDRVGIEAGLAGRLLAIAPRGGSDGTNTGQKGQPWTGDKPLQDIDEMERMMAVAHANFLAARLRGIPWRRKVALPTMASWDEILVAYDRLKSEIPVPDSFNEREYLFRNNDVANAVTNGDLPSGFEHFVRYGRAEGRPRP